MPLDQPGYLERLEESEALALAHCADLKDQLNAAASLIANDRRITREATNVLIAQEIKRLRQCDTDPSSSH